MDESFGSFKAKDLVEFIRRPYSSELHKETRKEMVDGCEGVEQYQNITYG